MKINRLFAGAMMSYTIYGQAPCDGQDHLAAWTYGWTNQPITVTGVEIAVQQGSDYLQKAIAGNSFTPDVMAWLGQYMSHTKAENLSFSFPPAYSPAPVSPGLQGYHHIDLHVSCRPGAGDFEGFETIFYTVGE